MNKDTVNGTAKKVTGKMQEVAADVKAYTADTKEQQNQAGKDKAAALGKQAEGSIQNAFGKIKDALTDN